MEKLDFAMPLSSEILHTSDNLGWREITVEHFQLYADELFVAPLENNIICMMLEDDFHVEQARNGKIFVHTFQRGEAQLLPTGTTGFWRFRQSSKVLRLHLPPALIQQIAYENTPLDPNRMEITDQFLFHDPQVKYISFALFAELLDGGKNGKLYRDALATALGTHLVRKYASVSAKPLPVPSSLAPALFQRVLEYIDSHLAEDIMLTALAGTVNISTSHFAALFKQKTGVSPYQYILNQRVQRAKNLLLQTDLTVAQIASEVGFYDQSHLTRHMRRLLKITPAALQRQRNVQNHR